MLTSNSQGLTINLVILEKTKNATPDSSIDHFLRNELFEGSTDFFRKNHSANQTYIDKLDGD